MSQNEIAIQATQLGKCYHVYTHARDRLKQLFAGKTKQYYREFWALKNIDFTLRKGESLGIIGRNGSGKSTLLQLICQTLTPSTGKVNVNGKIAALLELGAGFNPEFTGRENIFLNGALLGYHRREIQERLDHILAFADIGDFIDQPVKNYSSGMYIRLAFSIQACMEPDILIVDEALSVGDIFFQQKCAKRMEELRAQGTTLLFVSHDMSIVRDLCQHTLYLKQGQMVHYGKTTDAIRLFLAEQDALHEPKPIQQNTISHAITSNSLEAFKKSACWMAPESSASPLAARLVGVSIVDQHQQATSQVKMTDTVRFRILYQTLSDQPVDITIVMRNRYDHIVHSGGSYTNGLTLPALKAGEYAIFEMDMQCMLEAGNYTYSVILGSTHDTPVNQGKIIDESPRLGPLTITWNYTLDRAPWFGMFGVPTETRIITLND